MYKVISCGIFKPYIEKLDIDRSQYEFVYLKIKQHNQPNQLSYLIQKEIDKSLSFEKIIILYGVCGGALLGIHAIDVPIVIVRVHDCMSILLGSKPRYENITGRNKSIRWSCYSLKVENDYNDNIQEWELKYDQETVEYLKSILICNEQLYISFDLPEESQYVIEEKHIIKGQFEFLYQILTLKSKELIFLQKSQRIILSGNDQIVKIISK